MHIVGTAGHVDHGKSTLISALTGTNPDRLKEEIEREMTIDLGFASLALPGGETIGIIDVPGHRDFVGNMLSGIGGIDAVLLVIAANEGVSAQTREHLAILDLLEISRGLIVLTKCDLVTDREWLELVELEAQEVVEGTSLENAQVVRVSAQTGEGLDELKLKLAELLTEIPQKRDLNRPRLPVDRVFTLSGFGTVVTGTLLDGSFSLGDEVICLPGGKTGRIRGLQNHNRKLQKVSPGYRTAINLNNLSKEDIDRGDVIALPATYKPTTRLDASIRLIRDATTELKHNMSLKVFAGASETLARVRLLGVEALKPGEEGFVQLELEEPLVAIRGDHYVLRLPSPAATIGGGVILDAQPTRRYRRFDEVTLTRLEQLRVGKRADLVMQALNRLNVSNLAALTSHTSLSAAELENQLTELEDAGEVIFLSKHPNPAKTQLISTQNLQSIGTRILGTLDEFHQKFPLKAGISREQLKSILKLTQEQFDLVLGLLNQQGKLVERGTLVWAASHSILLTPQQESQAANLLVKFTQSPYSPPDVTEAEAELGLDVLEGLIATNRLIRVSDAVLFLPDTIESMKSWVQKAIQANGSVSLAQFRDHFQTSRKYAAAFLEYLDSIGYTLRKGDVRVLRTIKT
jgi:selenocysteine-specific elongation factor